MRTILQGALGTLSYSSFLLFALRTMYFTIQFPDGGTTDLVKVIGLDTSNPYISVLFERSGVNTPS